MSQLRVLLAAWFGNFRFKEFVAIVLAAFGLGHEVASQVGVEGDKAAKIAVATGIVAAVCYILNPKYAEWVKRSGDDTASAQHPQADADPLDESRDKDAGYDVDLYANSADKENK